MELLDNLKKKQDEEFEKKYPQQKGQSGGVFITMYEVKPLLEFIDKVRSETAEAVAREAEAREKLLKDTQNRIYEIIFNDHAYDQYDAFVVCAKNKKNAIEIIRRAYSNSDYVDWESGYEIKEVKFEKEEIILSSFNAG